MGLYGDTPLPVLVPWPQRGAAKAVYDPALPHLQCGVNPTYLLLAAVTIV